jgi:hypothetical protein
MYNRVTSFVFAIPYLPEKYEFSQYLGFLFHHSNNVFYMFFWLLAYPIGGATQSHWEDIEKKS